MVLPTLKCSKYYLIETIVFGWVISKWELLKARPSTFKKIAFMFIPNELLINLCQLSQRFGNVVKSFDKFLITITQAQEGL
jgi:hypothetical protein